MAAKAPEGLGEKALSVWTDLTMTYEFRADELRVLEDSCREIDLIERLEAELKTTQLVVKGSMGQPVSSPLVTEIRQHRATLARLLAALKIPDEADNPAARSSAARKAANARWGARGA